MGLIGLGEAAGGHFSGAGVGCTIPSPLRGEPELRNAIHGFRDRWLRGMRRLRDKTGEGQQGRRA